MNRIETLYQEWENFQPLNEKDSRRLNRKFMLEFNYNSNHLEGNTLTYGQTELLLLFGKVVENANMKDLEEMKASNVALNMVKEEAISSHPLTETFIHQLHHTLLRDDYTIYHSLPDRNISSYVIHAGQYKTRPNSVITRTGERFDYASPEETPALMSDLVHWYNEMERSQEITLPQLCAMFHYRYIRIHPFEDGNGRVARLLVNFILFRHNYPMIVIKSSDKENYLNALEQCDRFVGRIPSTGAWATFPNVQPFVVYIEKCIEETLQLCLKVARGESIEEDNDFIKELELTQREKRQKEAVLHATKQKNISEIQNVIELVYCPLSEAFVRIVNATHQVFSFSYVEKENRLSQTDDPQDGVIVEDLSFVEFSTNVKSIWFVCKLKSPNNPSRPDVEIHKAFYISFEEDYYFIDGSLSQKFPYGYYPKEKEKQEIIANFKQEILNELKEKL